MVLQHESSRINNMRAMCLYKVGDYHGAIKLSEIAVSIAPDQGGLAAGHNSLGLCYEALYTYRTAIEHFEKAKTICWTISDEESLALRGCVCGNLGTCYLEPGNYPQAIELYQECMALAKEAGNLQLQGVMCNKLGTVYKRQECYEDAVEIYTVAIALAEKVGDRNGLMSANSNLGGALAFPGRHHEAVPVLARALVEARNMENDLGIGDAVRVSYLEELSTLYMRLEQVLLWYHKPGWAMGVADQAKARALSFFLYLSPINLQAGGGANTSNDTASDSYEKMFESWWVQMQGLACAEGSATCIVEFSFLRPESDELAVWVLSGTGELLCSTLVLTAGLSETKGRTIQQLLDEAHTCMKAKGRDAIASSCTEPGDETDAGHSEIEQDEPFTMRGPRCKMFLLGFQRTIVR